MKPKCEVADSILEANGVVMRFIRLKLRAKAQKLFRSSRMLCWSFLTREG